MTSMRRALFLVTAMVCAAVVSVRSDAADLRPLSAVASAPGPAVVVPLSAVDSLTAKAPKVSPSKPHEPVAAHDESAALRQAFLANEVAATGSLLDLVAADTTAPSAPTITSAVAQQLSAISATWTAAQDPESAISYYVFGIGTIPTGDYSTLANTRWWQVNYATSVTVNLTLTAGTTYYFSVYAVNAAGLSSPIRTSGPIQVVARPLGHADNALRLAFATTGYDASGNAIAGWRSDQIAAMTTFFNKMYPLVRQIYGPPADDYTVTIVRDLRYSSSNIFLPDNDEIRMDDGFYPQLFTHELLHAFRNDHLLSSNQNWDFDPTLSGFEEGFAQAVSYEAMNRYVQTYPNDTQVAGNTLWGSSNDWDYDFQNTLELRGTDFWSEGGATGLHWLKYEMGAAALRKINIESADFYRRFNQEYYARINANPITVKVSRAMIVDVIRTVVPQIEGMPAASWIDKQHIFYAQNVPGLKIFHRIQDYPASDLYAFHDLYFMNTMSCGSEWACWDGTQWVYHRLNGAQGTGKLTNNAGATIWSGNLLIEPTQNPATGWFGIGHDTKTLTTALSNQPWPGGNVDDFILNLRTMGLYKFDSTFVDPLNGASTTNSIYRVLGAPIASNFQGVWGGVVGRSSGTVTLTRDGYAPVSLPVSNGAFFGATTWTGVANPRTGGRDSVPGRVSITFVDSTTGQSFQTQRNVDYGNVNGSQMFLLDFGGGTAPGDGTPPTASVTSPAGGASVSGTVTLTAAAADDVGVTSVQFTVDNQNVGAPLTTGPYTLAWNSTTVANGSHAVRVVARDAAGNTTTSSPVDIVVANPVPDGAPPTVSLTAPAAGTVTNTVTITASATDNVGVTKVEFLVDGVVIATDTSAPYSASWNTNTSALGGHSLTAKAYDAANNSATSAARSVTVVDSTRPTVSVTNPANNALVNRNSNVTITASASDNRGVTRVEFFVNNTLRCTDTTAGYSCVWPVPSARGVRYTIRVRAYDASNNFTDATIAVTSRS